MNYWLSHIRPETGSAFWRKQRVTASDCSSVNIQQLVAYIHVYISTATATRIPMCTYTYIYIHVHAYVHIHKYICICIGAENTHETP